MSRLTTRFATLRQKGSAALIPYITAGDPEPGLTVELMHVLARAGADVIELGVPFSDPMADGPVIQAACERALHHHVSLRDVLGMVRTFRAGDPTTPVVLMGYLNPIEAMGYETFAVSAAKAGVDGALTIDLPPEEGAALVAPLRREGVDPIFLLAPTSSTERIARICAVASGFVYYVSLKGVTGAASLDLATVADKLAEIRRFTGLPVGVGFGIKDPETAARVAGMADAVIVGSALVKRIAETTDRAQLMRELADLVSSMRQAMDHQAPHERQA